MRLKEFTSSLRLSLRWPAADVVSRYVDVSSIVGVATSDGVSFDCLEWPPHLTIIRQ